MLTLRGVGKSYAGRPVLRDISFDVGPGEFLCLVGPSGCGKSTLLNMVAGFEAPSQGALLLDSQPIRAAGRDRVVVFQDSGAALFPWLTTAENVAFGLRLAGTGAADVRTTVGRLLRLVNLQDDAHKFPGQLSGGMRQRVQIARALAMQPKVLLMDEPFASLDAHTRRFLHRELLRIWAETGQTILFVTHDVSEAMTLADRVVVLSRGPATVREVLEVDLPRPRQATDPRLLALVERADALLSIYEEEVS